MMDGIPILILTSELAAGINIGDLHGTFNALGMDDFQVWSINHNDEI